MIAVQAAARFGIVREAGGRAVDEDLLEIWDSLDTLRPEDMLGEWHGFAFDTGHPVSGLLERSRWWGKRFGALDDVQPLLCVGDDGELYSDTVSGKGEASLWNVEFRGEVTASMVYDGQAVIDHFKRVDADTVMGVMNGKAKWVLDHGRHFWFGLERVR